MATLLTAVMTDRLLDPDSSAAFRDFLEVKFGFSLLIDVIRHIDSADAALGRPLDPNRKFFSKIGILIAQTQFLHVRIRQNDYSVVALGLLPVEVNGVFWDVPKREAQLFKRIHTIIAAANP